MKSFGRPRWTTRRFSVPELPEKAKEGVVHADATEAGGNAIPRGLGQRQPSASRRRATEAQRQRRRASNRAAEYEEKVQLYTALQSAVHCSWHTLWPRDTGTWNRGRSADKYSDMAARPLHTYRGIMVAERHMTDLVLVPSIFSCIRVTVGYRASVMHFNLG